MSLIGIAAVHAGRRPPTELARLPDGTERTLTVECVSRHVRLQSLLAQLFREGHALRWRHGQLALLALAPEIGHQLARAHTPSVTRQAPLRGEKRPISTPSETRLQPQALPDRLTRRLRTERTAHIGRGLVGLDGVDH